MSDPAARDLPLLEPGPEAIAAAVRALAAGRLVLHPTETVASLSGDPHSVEAVRAARGLKGYEEPRPFLCLVADRAAARALAAVWPAPVDRLARAFWPGPLTIVVEAGPGAPAPVVADGRIALRPAADRVSAALVAAHGGPVFSTSANRRGEEPALTVDEAAEALLGWPGAEAVMLGILEPADEEIERGERPSTLVDGTSDPPRVVRSGAIGIDRIRAVLSDRDG